MATSSNMSHKRREKVTEKEMDAIPTSAISLAMRKGKSVPTVLSGLKADKASASGKKAASAKGSVPTMTQTNGKSSLKTPASGAANGKDGGSDKSRRGHRVQFESSDDIMEDKVETSNGKGVSSSNGKGGKGDQAANGGKPAVAKGGPLQLKVDQGLPKNSKFLMDCEAAEILQSIDERMVGLSEDPSIKMPAPFVRGLQYAKTGAKYTSPGDVRKALEPLGKLGVSDAEICMIGNISAESVEEVFALVPSLKSKKAKLEKPLGEALTQLASLRNSP